MTETITEININAMVKVKLTELGYNLHADYHNSFLGIPNYPYRSVEYFKQNVDEDGYTKFQLWQLMHEFGSVLTIGSPLYFETDILIVQ